MDEIGFIITHITSDGLLKFKPIGGLDKRMLVSKKVVVGEDKIPGVIGAKAIHLQKPKERKQILDYNNLYIDIGADGKEEAQKTVEIGDRAAFTTQYSEIGSNRAKGKAFDDRVGCAILINILKNNYDFPLYGVFTVQEEVGTRGIQPVAYRIDPDLALVVEGTTASDVPDSEEHEYSTTLGQGPALTMQDRSIIPHQGLLKHLLETAETEEIDYQWRKSTSAGTDAGPLQLTKEGIPTAAVSVPCRYIHSPVSLLDLDDYQQTKQLVAGLCQKLAQGGISHEELN
jgi:endoglucanase